MASESKTSRSGPSSSATTGNLTSRLQALRDVTNTSLKRNGCGQKSTAPQKGKGANPSLSNARISARCDNTPDRTKSTELSNSFASTAGGPIQSCPEASQGACDWRRQHFPIVTLSPNGRAELAGDAQHESPTSSAGVSGERAKGTAELVAVYHYQDVTDSVRTQNSSIAMAASPGAHDATDDDASCGMEMDRTTAAEAQAVAVALSPAHAQGGIEAPAQEPDARPQAHPAGGSEDAGRGRLLGPSSHDAPQADAACATDGTGEHANSETAPGAADKVETWWECDFCSRAFESLALASTHEERCARNPARAGILPAHPQHP